MSRCFSLALEPPASAPEGQTLLGLSDIHGERHPSNDPTAAPAKSAKSAMFEVPTRRARVSLFGALIALLASPTWRVHALIDFATCPPLGRQPMRRVDCADPGRSPSRLSANPCAKKLKRTSPREFVPPTRRRLRSPTASEQRAASRRSRPMQRPFRPQTTRPRRKAQPVLAKKMPWRHRKGWSSRSQPRGIFPGWRERTRLHPTL